MSSIKDFNNIKYELINPNGAGDKVVKATFDYKGEHFSYNVIVPNNPKIKKEKYYIKEAKKTFITLANNGELAKSADARIHAKRVKNFSDFDYEVINSSVVGYAEVRATLKYQDKLVTRYLFIKEIAGKKDDYYIDQAKAEIRKEIINDELPKESKKYLKPKKVSTAGKVAIAVLGVAAVGCGTFLTYKFLNPNFTVSFDTNGGTSIEAQSVQKGKLAKEPEDPLKHGYDFEGWCSDEECKTPFDFTKDTINKNTVLYADWAAVECTITVDPNVEGVQPYSIIAAYDNLLDKIDPPDNEHYIFAGWYKTPKDGKEEDEPYNFNTPVDGDFTLTAHWDKEVYTVSFDLDGGTGYGDYSMQYVKYDEHAHDPIIDVEIDKPTKTGYTFDYWYDSTLEEPVAFDFETGIDRNYVLKAHWSEDPVNVIFDFKDGTTEPETKQVLRGHTIEASQIPEIPDYTGHTFTGWFDEDGEEFKFENPITADVTYIYAHWDPNTYTVTFNSVGGGDVDPIPVKYDETIPVSKKPADPTKSGFEFAGWFTKSDETGIPFIFDDGEATNPTHVIDNMTLYAHWNKATINAIFDPGDGKWIGAEEGKEQDPINVPTLFGEMPVDQKNNLVYEHHTFTGWKRLSDGGIGIIPMDADGETYTAQWDIDQVTVTINPNGAAFTDGVTTPKVFDIDYGTTWADFVTEHETEIEINKETLPQPQIMGDYKYQYYDTETSAWKDFDGEYIINANLSIKAEFIPKNPEAFATDSWETFTTYLDSHTYAEMIDYDEEHPEKTPYYNSYHGTEGGKQPDTFVGLTRTVVMNGSYYSVRVIGEDTEAGVEDAKFTFEFVDTLELDVIYSSDETNNSYVDSYINNHLNQNFYYLLPEAVRNSIKESSIKCYGEDNPITVNMFILSASELGFEKFPDVTQTETPDEGSAYAYYENGGSTIKSVYGGSEVNYWTRTPDIYGVDAAAWNVNTDGELGIDNQSIATNSGEVYIAPAFRV